MVLYLRSLLTTNFKYTKTLLSKDNKVFLASQERFELPLRPFPYYFIYFDRSLNISSFANACRSLPHIFTTVQFGLVSSPMFCTVKLPSPYFRWPSANFSVKSLSFDLAIFAPSPFLYDLLKPSNQSQVQSIGDSHFPLLLIVTHCRG